MRIETRLFATLRKYVPDAPQGVLTMDVPDGVTVAELLRLLGVNAADVHLIMVNGQGSAPERVLAGNDRVGLFPPIGGG